MSIKSHPPGLYILFFTEAWERFSYYGMRALLVLYMVKQLNFKREDALAIYAAYTGLVYLTPMLGGYLADKYLGARKAIIIGGIVMALGHLAMAFENQLYFALGLLIVGNGFFKPNISTIVGGLYEENDPRSDGGFTIFYMGINLGAFFSPLVCGTLGESQRFGWHWGFSAAGVGMILGLLVFLAGQKLIGRAGFPPDVEVDENTRLKRSDWKDIIVYSTCCVAFVYIFLYFWQFIGPHWNLLHFAAKGAIIVSIMIALELIRQHYMSKEKCDREHLTAEEWQRILVICILAIFSIFFWVGFEQAGGTMNLFADEQTDRHLFGWEIPASYFQSINPLAIMIFAPLFSALWIKIDESRYAISTPVKMAIGLIVLGLGFVVMYCGQGVAEKFGKAGPMWLASVYLIHTAGELCLSPIGLSMVTKLSPPRVVSLMMGIWFVSSSVSDYTAGRLEELLTAFKIPLYGFLVAISMGAGVLLILINPLLKKWMHGRG